MKFAEHQEAIETLSKALADMIEMYAQKKRSGVRLGKARAALTNHGVWPTQSPVSEEVSR